MNDKKRPIRVGIDATPMLVAQRTGIERYATALIRELTTLYATLDDIQLLVYLHAGNPYASAEHMYEARQMLTSGGVPHRIYRPRYGYGLFLSIYALFDQLDLLHMLRSSRPLLQTCPYVLTVHDLKAVGLSEEGQRIEKAAQPEKEGCIIRDAMGLITVSESTANDLRKAFQEELKMPIRTIHHGVDNIYLTSQDEAEAMRQKYGLDRYIFFIGTLQYRKNLPRLIEAFALVKREHQIPHKLVLAGRDGWGAELVYQAVEEQGVNDSVLFPGYIPESDLPGLYAGADLFAYPSLHEGFGIPLLEAMAAGTVVYTSNLFSIPEVAGDAALYIDPYDVGDMARGLQASLSDNLLREELIKRGQERANKFSWQQMTRQTIHFYQEIGSKS